MRSTIMLLACVAVLAGCTALVVGGGATGGQPAGPSTPASDDVAIAGAVMDRLNVDRGVQTYDVDVSVRGGVVTLSGSVQSERMRSRADEIARATEGVRRVENELKVILEP